MRLAGINLISAKLFLLRGTVDALLKINEPQTSNAQLARGEQALVCKIPLSPPLEKGEAMLRSLPENTSRVAHSGAA